MKLEYREAEHLYLVDGQPIPSLTQMLGADGCSDHLDSVPAATLQAKTEWGTRLHLALQKVEYGFGVDEGFKQHCIDWLTVCERMRWGKNHFPIWKVCELPVLAQVEGLVFGFTPDRAAPEAVVEIKGTYSMHYGHGIQTALQVIGMGYSRETPRYVCYFDKEGLKKLATCGDTIKRDGRILNVWDEAERIMFDHAYLLEAA
jgi:hypothetical protein